MMIPGWFVAALVPLIVSQTVRLHQHDAASWMFWDYAGRLCALGVLAAIPTARVIAFRSEAPRLPLWKVALWIGGIMLLTIGLNGLREAINAAIPMTVLGAYPRPHGWLRLLDLTLGLALVAFSEEIVFRRCARHMLTTYLGDGMLVLATSLLFGCYHWWAGLGAMVDAALVGALFMIFYQRSGALWPVVIAHDLIDLYFFA
jgi:uncharacterized protein